MKIFEKNETTFFNQVLDNDTVIKEINNKRPKLFFYTDFGGGTAQLDLQTSGELASAAWKSTIHQTLWINNSAVPLSIIDAAYALVATFGYLPNEQQLYETTFPVIHTIVVHVVDPGVGNSNDGSYIHPRALALRKDGVLFVGPDNGSLTFVCPPGSIAGIWQINADLISKLSNSDLKAGGTFHGRDLFCEVACRIAAGTYNCDTLGIPYPTVDIKHRLQNDYAPEKDAMPILFEQVETHRFQLTQLETVNQDVLFEQAFLLGIVQAPGYAHDAHTESTCAKKIFIVHPSGQSRIPFIAIVNAATGNIYVGPNNGIGTSFFVQYCPSDVTYFEINKEIFTRICTISNNEEAHRLIKEQPIFEDLIVEISLLGDEQQVLRDSRSRPTLLHARIWIDAYGNIKTTGQNYIIDDAQKHGADIKVTLNSVTRTVISTAQTFSEVPREEIFIYNGSSAVIGDNPRRSKRYIEVSSNGTFGKFGIDYFKNNGGGLPCNGQLITFLFIYK